MSDKSGIIRKIAALRAKGLDSSLGEAEANAFMTKANDLMQEYNVSLSDVDIQTEEVGVVIVKTGNKHLHDVAGCADAIATLTETIVFRGEGGSLQFVGTKTDQLFAVYLTELLMASVDRSTEAFKKTMVYKIATTVKKLDKKDVHKTFRRFMVGRLRERMLELHRQNVANKPVSDGKSLVLLKNAIVQAFIENNDMGKPENSQGKVEAPLELAEQARKAADSVQLGRALETQGQDVVAYLTGGQK